MDLRIEAGVEHGSLSPAFRRFVEGLLPLAGDALDLGCGAGRAALLVAPRARRVVGIDVDTGAVEAARAAAARMSLPNVEFVAGDAMSSDLRGLNRGRGFLLVAAHLFFEVGLPERAAAALEPGGHLVVSALEAAHWKEAGGSRFNVDAAATMESLAGAGFDVQDACIERSQTSFGDAASAKEFLKDHRLWPKWRDDGRWDAWKAHLRRGGATLTDSRLTFWAATPSL